MNTTMKKKKLGYYSAQQANHYARYTDAHLGNSVTPLIYELVAGGEATITEICDEDLKPVGPFDDFVCVGEVVEGAYRKVG